MVVRFAFCAALVLVASCDAKGAPPECTPGMSIGCSCSDGAIGAQACGDNGRYEACVCASATTDAGGFHDAELMTMRDGGGPVAADAGCVNECPGIQTYCRNTTELVRCALGPDGCTHLTTVNPSCHCLINECVECIRSEDCGDITKRCDASGDATHPRCIHSEFWADTRVVFDGGAQERHWTNCYTCSASFVPARNELSVTFQQGDGYDIWTLDLVRAPYIVGTRQLMVPASGNDVFSLSVSDPMFPARLSGGYRPESLTLTISDVDARHGGRIAGHITGTLTGGNDTNPITATFDSTFYAEFPQ